MIEVLSNRTYLHLFSAQVIALVGTGLATIALGLLAYDIAGADAGAVLGYALTVKMAAYILVGPIASAFVGQFDRKAVLVAMDLVRAAVALCLPFVDQVWQVYVLIFLLQSASATFTPTFQATIPEVLPEDRDYTRALSLSRMAYDMESLTSPILAAALLTLLSFHWLFAGTAIGFLLSAGLVVTSALPKRKTKARAGGIYEKTTRGIRIYLKTPRLRGLLAITLTAAAASAMVIVNTVVIVKGLGLSQSDVALTLAAFGGGSIVAALVLPKLLDRVAERTVMLTAAAFLVFILAGLAVAANRLDGSTYWHFLLGAWLLLGVGYSMCVTPSGKLLKRSSGSDDRPALFAAQFALSHACWLIAYPSVGQIGATTGMDNAFWFSAAMGAVGLGLAILIWPIRDAQALPHLHPDLPADHPHLRDHDVVLHDFVIDELHPTWPKA
jgi:MFS family permease